ncbi:rCG23437, isoform CRA_a [Rattus norvegicus]|uniref:RCG23437, isoform CRA_a n=1 Tax=Rattus norvegicus TaxID=10116 RepID=A6KGW7_RAT|nr:rCG23437, isoform CRA_a [Rattus norvegicus]
MLLGRSLASSCSQKGMCVCACVRAQRCHTAGGVV